MADPKPPPDDLSSLRARVARARKNDDGAGGDKPPQSAAALAMRMGGEFGAAILVGALAGYGADYLLHSSPWGLVIGLGLGFVAGIVNVARAAASFSARAGKDDS